MSVNALALAAASTTKASNQPQRRMRPVVVPNSTPSVRILVAGGVQQFGRKGASPTRVVYAFAMPITRSIRVGPTPAPDAGAAGDRVGRGDVGVGAVVDVEMVGLGALEQHDLVGVQRGVQHPADVGDVGRDPLGVGQQVLGDLDRIEGGRL